MGLTIHYTFRFNGDDDEARNLLARLREHALTLSFERVGNIVDLAGNACNYEHEDADPRDGWLLIQSTHNIERGDSFISVPPKRLIAFSTLPAEGSESANFGLCQYPMQIISGGQTIDTGLSADWHSHSFCKTQYASNPQFGGAENFLRCHIGLVQLLDFAKTLGILAEVTDESDYWVNRDPQALRQTIEQWNQMIAGFVGQMKDSIQTTDVQAPITEYPNFEHLEAEGRKQDQDSGEVAED